MPRGPFIVVRTITVREPRQARAGSIALHQRAREPKFVQVEIVVFGRSREARKPWIRQRWVDGEAMRGVGVEEGMDKAFGCGALGGAGCQRMEVR